MMSLNICEKLDLSRVVSSAFISIPCIESARYGSSEMSHKTHGGAPSDDEIDCDQKKSSLIVTLSMGVEIVGVDREERESETTSANRRIIRKHVEKNTDKNRCPCPEKPCIPFPMRDFYDSTYGKKKEDIAEHMQKSSMQETVEREFSQEAKETNWIIVYPAVDDDIWNDDVNDSSENWNDWNDIDGTLPINSSYIGYLYFEVFHIGRV